MNKIQHATKYCGKKKTSQAVTEICKNIKFHQYKYMTEMIEQGEPINPTFMYFKLVPKKS